MCTWYVIRKGNSFRVSSIVRRGYRVVDYGSSKGDMERRVLYHAAVAANVIRKEGSYAIGDYIYGSLKSWYRNSFRSSCWPSYSITKAIYYGFIAYAHRNDIIGVCEICHAVIRNRHGACSGPNGGYIHEKCYDPTWGYSK